MKSLKRNLTVLFSLLAAMASPLAAQEEAAQLAVLKNPEATLAEKQEACRSLARTGTAQAVPVLASLLSDAQLSHMARMALEPIPDSAVDSALRDALGTVKGNPLLGVIGSLGVRGDEKAVPALAGFLADPEAGVAAAAARALGRIGSAEASQALQSNLDKASPRQFQELCEGLLRCAESLTAKGQVQQASQIYDRLAGFDKAPHQIRTAAFRGAVLTRGADGLPVLLAALRDADFAKFASALRTARELKDAKLPAALAAELAGLPAERQILVIDFLGKRGDPVCAPALLPLGESGETPVRIAAVKALTRLVHAPVIPVLAKLVSDSDSELATTARECLASFPDKAADEAVLKVLASPDAASRVLATGLIAQRNLDVALPALMNAASSDPEETVRVAALKELRDIVGTGELDALLKILLESKSAAVIQAATHAVAALCARQPFTGTIEIIKAVYGDLDQTKTADVTKKAAALVKAGATSIEASNRNFNDPAPGISKQLTVHYSADGVQARKTVAEGESVTLTSPSVSPAVADPLLAAFARASGPAKVALLRILQRVGGPKALEAIRTAAASDGDAAVRESAQRMLCEWPTPEALPAVRALATNPPSANLKAPAMRGWLRLIPLQPASAEEKLAQVKDALALVDNKEEKRAVLGALGEIPLAESLALVVPSLDDPELVEEACVAAVAIAGQIAGQHPAEVQAAMKKVTKLTTDKRIKGQAGKIARETQAK